MDVRGIHPMLFAFFDEAGGLSRDAFRAQVEAAAACGADGVAVLGLGTEVSKLTPDERRQVVAWAAEDLADLADPWADPRADLADPAVGRLPLAVTVFGATPDEQTAFARFARQAGADWLILQAPREPMDEPALIRFFGATADRLDCPVAVQNAKVFLGVGLSLEGLAELHRAHPNVTIVKAEDSAVEIGRLVERLGGAMTVLNGRAGLELTDNFRAGAAGMIPGLETIDLQARIWRLMAAGDEDGAEAQYRELLPVLAFAMQGIDHFLLYGKAVAAHRLGLPLSRSRAPAAAPHPLGHAWAARMARRLGPLPRAGAAGR